MENGWIYRIQPLTLGRDSLPASGTPSRLVVAGGTVSFVGGGNGLLHRVAFDKGASAVFSPSDLLASPRRSFVRFIGRVADSDDLLLNDGQRIVRLRW